jgi:hypothetical protein
MRSWLSKYFFWIFAWKSIAASVFSKSKTYPKNQQIILFKHKEKREIEAAD